MSYRNRKLSRSTSKDSDSFNSSFSSVSSSVNSRSSIFNQIPRGIRGESDLEWKRAKNCYICNTKFSVKNRRHHCRFCGNSICSEHGIKRRTKEEKKILRICDNCDRELIRNEIQVEIEHEIKRIQLEVSIARDLNEKLHKDNYEKTSRVNQLEMDLSKAEKNQKQKEQALQERLLDEQNKAERTRNAIEELRKNLEETHQAEIEISKKCTEADTLQETLKAEAESLKARKEEMETQITSLTRKLEGSYPLDHIREIVCKTCTFKLDKVYRPSGLVSTSNSIIDKSNEIVN